MIKSIYTIPSQLGPIYLVVCSLDWIALCMADRLPLAIRVVGLHHECAAAQSSSRSSLIPSFEDCSFHYSCVSRKCRRLRMYAVPCAVSLLYDLGVLALFVTLARSHVFRIGFSTRIVCSSSYDGQVFNDALLMRSIMHCLFGGVCAAASIFFSGFYCKI